MHVLIPYWAIISLAFLFLSLAQFEAYKKLYRRIQKGQPILSPVEARREEEIQSKLKGFAQSNLELFKYISIHEEVSSAELEKKFGSTRANEIKTVMSRAKDEKLISTRHDNFYLYYSLNPVFRATLERVLHEMPSLWTHQS
jgi:hypothetical protein